MSWVIYNDLALWPWYLSTLITCFILYVCSIVWHELGHMVFFKRKKKQNINIKIGYQKPFILHIYAGEVYNYKEMSDQDMYYANFSGIVFGFIPIIIVSLLDTAFPYILMFTPYLVGCIPDIIQMVKYNQSR